VPVHGIAKIEAVINSYKAIPEIFAERIRIQNLRFAHFLCAAQEMSGVIKR
jgi:hypothetical protein